MDSVAKSSPIPDAVSQFYWDAAGRGQLVVQGFEGSDVRQFPPESVAIGATGEAGASVPVAVSGRGRLYAFTVLRQVFHPAYVEEQPVILALTELEDAPGVRILTNLIDVDPADLTVGLELEVVFEQRGETRIPQFRPIAGAA